MKCLRKLAVCRSWTALNLLLSRTLAALQTLLTQSFTTRVPDAKLHPKAKQRYIDAMVQTGTMEQMFEILKELHYDAGE